ncbi:MAG: PilZ domain-containing protein [Thermoanaerobaculia bacterium]
MSDLDHLNRPERRAAIRVSKSIDFLYSSDSPPIPARIEDLSESGAYVDTTHALTVGTKVDFSFHLPGSSADAKPILGRGRVAWVDPMVGVGLEFLDLEEDDRKQIRFYVASVFFGDERTDIPVV